MSINVLVIEDNANNFYLLDCILKSGGYATMHAWDGLQGLEMAHQNQPDLILMDIQMPNMDGIEATHRLKADVATQAIPIVGVSSFVTLASRQAALGAGMADFIAKPISPKTFLTQIQAYLSGNPPPPSASSLKVK